MKTNIYHTVDKKIIKTWEKLWEQSPYANNSNSPQWLISVLETFKYKDFIIITVCNDDNVLQGIGYLVKEKQYGIDVYTIPPADFVCGSPFLIDYQNKKLTAAFYDALVQIGNVLLNNVPEEIITEMKKQTLPMVSLFDSRNYRIAVNKDSKGKVMIQHRSRLLRKVRGIENKFILKHFNGNDRKALNLAFALDQESRKQTRGYNVFSDESLKSFFGCLAGNFKEYFQFNILYFGEIPIAYEMGFMIGNIYFGNQMAFAEKYSQYTPGKLMLVKLIERAGTQNVTTIDCGSGDNALKRSLTDEYRLLYKVIISKNNTTRLYIKTVAVAKRNLFTTIEKHVRLYLFYRNARKLIHISL